jgi:FkbH-like protein
MGLPIVNERSHEQVALAVEQLLQEHRPIPPPEELGIEFDEAWYLRSYADVAEAVTAGRCPSALLHYLWNGEREGRLPLPPTEIRIPRSVDIPTEAGLEGPLHTVSTNHNGAKYLCPSDLSVTAAPMRRVIVIGSCFVQALGLTNTKGTGEHETEFLLTNNVSRLPDLPPKEPTTYDLQVIQIALRSVLPDSTLWHIPFADRHTHQAAFEAASSRLAFQLDSLLAWNKEFGIPAFVMNFLVPQQNPLGRLMPRYDLRNPAYFIERLNAELEELLSAYRDVYLLDVDKIAASLGRRYIQDDLVAHLSHNSVVVAPRFVEDRIELLRPLTEHYQINWSPIFCDAVWEEIAAMYRTLRQIDPVKLVVVDLDDTMWIGVSGEMETVGPEMVEGWPIGVAEALAFLKKRGVLLAILSKNDDERVSARWDDIFGGRLRLADFATRRINWNPKSTNMHEILAEVNLLPRNVVFIDDNPVERSAMKRAFPDMRVIGRYPYYVRRILLWSPEAQVAIITNASGRRSDMVKAQIDREAHRRTLTREEFLQSLGIKVRLFLVRPEDAQFARTFELLNKTNQFNTTGKRWRSEEFLVEVSPETELFAFEVDDNYASYGLVGVLLVREAEIVQYVMSCRVVGLDVEIAALVTVINLMRRRGVATVNALFVTTDANLLCRDLYPSLGFTEQPGGWTLEEDAAVAVPGHIQVMLA